MEFDFKAEDPSVRPFRVRLVWALGIAVFLYLVLFTRFAWLQLFNRENYAERAEKNRTVAVTSQGSRGLIFDRNGTLVAGNELEYSLEITPDRVKDIEKTIDELSTVVTITPADRRRFKRLREDFNRYDSIPIRTQLTDVEMAVFTAQKHRFPGVEINQLERRIYPNGAVGSHFIGYIGSISQNDKKRLDEEARSRSTKVPATSGRWGWNAATRRNSTARPVTKSSK